MENKTDCRSESGITVGLIDALISISRVLAVRLECEIDQPISEALKDLRADNDLNYIVAIASVQG